MAYLGARKLVVSLVFRKRKRVWENVARAPLRRNLGEAKQSRRARKLTDQEPPNSLRYRETVSGEAQMYRELLEMERKLDRTMMRRKVEIEDVSMRLQPVPQAFRISLRHTVSGRVWKWLETGDPAFTFDIWVSPAWQLKTKAEL